MNSLIFFISLFFTSIYASTLQQQWQQWLTDRNQFLKTDPESPLALEDTYYLQNNETIYLNCASKNYDPCQWIKSQNNKDQISLTYSHAKLLIFWSGNKVAKLQPGKTWKSKEGLIIGSSIISGSSTRVFVYNPQNPKITAFKSIKYFLFDNSAVVTAQVKKFEKPLLVELPMSTSHKTTGAYKVGQITFRYKTHNATLDIYTFSNPNSLDLFIPFHDTTNGSTTYGGGRFVEPHLSSLESKEVVVDFNQAHSSIFMCTYS